MIYAHPCKPVSHLLYAKSVGVEMMTFVGTIGLFLTLFLLFLRFLPCINIAEVKWAKLESDPHFEDNESHPDIGTVEIAAYQHELTGKN
jgi:molybdopterin-containing oxidoreductase family membrane subunit